tara:strand:- start:302 stop:475 length:174 start_codon:yes stop_codon:yes gene_type:complete
MHHENVCNNDEATLNDSKTSGKINKNKVARKRSTLGKERRESIVYWSLWWKIWLNAK